MRYRDIPKIVCKKGTKASIRKMVKRLMDDEWIRNGTKHHEAIQRKILDQFLFGESQTKVTWEGGEIKIQ